MNGMIDYSKELFNVGEFVSFDVIGTDIKGYGIIGGKASNGLAQTWSIIVTSRDTEFMKKTPELVIIVQANFIKNMRKIK